MTRERGYWLAVAGDTNCAILAELGHPYYALSRAGGKMASAIAAGDHFVLYRARTRGGFIGVYEAVEPARNAPTRVGARTYSTRIPWKPLLLCESKPAELAPLVPKLSFIVNKQRYGSHLQLHIKRLSRADFDIIERAVLANAKT